MKATKSPDRAGSGQAAGRGTPHVRWSSKAAEIKKMVIKKAGSGTADIISGKDQESMVALYFCTFDGREHEFLIEPEGAKLVARELRAEAMKLAMKGDTRGEGDPH